MTSDAYIYSEKCRNCRRYQAHSTHERMLQRSSPGDTFQFVPSNILDPLAKKIRNHFIVDKMDRWFKVTTVILTAMVSDAKGTKLVLDAFLKRYGILGSCLAKVYQRLQAHFSMTRASHLKRPFWGQPCTRYLRKTKRIDKRGPELTSSDSISETPISLERPCIAASTRV